MDCDSNNNNNKNINISNSSNNNSTMQNSDPNTAILNCYRCNKCNPGKMISIPVADVTNDRTSRILFKWSCTACAVCMHCNNVIWKIKCIMNPLMAESNYVCPLSAMYGSMCCSECFFKTCLKCDQAWGKHHLVITRNRLVCTKNLPTTLSIEEQVQKLLDIRKEEEEKAAAKKQIY